MIKSTRPDPVLVRAADPADDKIQVAKETPGVVMLCTQELREREDAYIVLMHHQQAHQQVHVELRTRKRDEKEITQKTHDSP